MAEAGLIGKPRGGLWTCRQIPGQGSPWIAWCQDTGNERFLAERSLWRLTAPDPLIYTIDSRLSFELARADHPYPWSHEAAWEDSTEPAIDIPVLAEVYDAVELTAQGLDETRFAALSMYTWDVPTILWLRWVDFEITPLT